MSEDAPRRSMLEVTEARGASTVLALSGELDPGTAPVLQARLADLAGDASVATVVLDLAGITFLDSSGVRALINGVDALGARSAELILRAPTPNVRRVLEVTGLAELVRVE